MSFEDVRSVLVLAYADGYLDDEEFMILYDYYQPVNLSFPYWNFDPFCSNFRLLRVRAHFRVAKDGLPILMSAFQILASFKCSQGTVCSGLEGLAISLPMLLFRFSFKLCTSGTRALHDS